MANTDNQSNNMGFLCLNSIQPNYNYTHCPHQPKKLCPASVTLQSNSTESDYKLIPYHVDTNVHPIIGMSLFKVIKAVATAMCQLQLRIIKFLELEESSHSRPLQNPLVTAQIQHQILLLWQCQYLLPTGHHAYKYNEFTFLQTSNVHRNIWKSGHPFHWQTVPVWRKG